MRVSPRGSRGLSPPFRWLGRVTALLPLLGTTAHACSLMAPSDAELTASEVTRGDGAVDGEDEQAAASGDAQADASDALGDLPVSECESPAAPCARGDEDTEEQPCGACDTGTRVRTRRCLPEICAWSPWSAWGACSNVTAACAPGDRDTEVLGCGPCNTGKQSRTRACSASCTWGAWSGWGACGGITAQCEPDHWRCCGTGKWEWCRASTCTWSADCDATSCANSPYCTC